MVVEKKCYIHFKAHFQANDLYKDILDMFKEIKQLDRRVKGESISSREKAFGVIFNKATNTVCPIYFHHIRALPD